MHHPKKNTVRYDSTISILENREIESQGRNNLPKVKDYVGNKTCIHAHVCLTLQHQDTLSYISICGVFITFWVFCYIFPQMPILLESEYPQLLNLYSTPGHLVHRYFLLGVAQSPGSH